MREQIVLISLLIFWASIAQAAAGAHEAVNSILAAQGKTTSDGMDAAGKNAVVSWKLDALDNTTYAIANDTVVTNVADDADLLTRGAHEADLRDSDAIVDAGLADRKLLGVLGAVPQKKAFRGMRTEGPQRANASRRLPADLDPASVARLRDRDPGGRFSACTSRQVAVIGRIKV